MGEEETNWKAGSFVKLVGGDDTEMTIEKVWFKWGWPIVSSVECSWPEGEEIKRQKFDAKILELIV